MSVRDTTRGKSTSVIANDFLLLDQTTPQTITGDTPKLDTLKSKTILGTDSDGKIITGTHQDISGLLQLDQTSPQTITTGIPLLTGLTPSQDYEIATKKYVDDNSGVGAHSDLTGLDYASAGHTGFQPAGSYLTANQTITLSGDVTGSGETSISTTAKANLKIASFGITVDGNGAACTTGSKGYIVIPWAGTITNWYIVGNASGDAVIDLKRSGTSIIGAGNKPTLSSAQRANAAAASWTSVAITANDEIEFNVDSCATCTRLNLIIYATRT